MKPGREDQQPGELTQIALGWIVHGMQVQDQYLLRLKWGKGKGDGR